MYHISCFHTNNKIAMRGIKEEQRIVLKEKYIINRIKLSVEQNK